VLGHSGTIIEMTGYLAGIGAMALLGAAGYQSMAPTGQWFGRTFTGVSRASRELALTFDDGPNEIYTPRLLDVLAKHSVPATFFMIGRYVERYPEIARCVADAGHAIGNHTQTHPNLIFSSAFQTRTQLEDCRRALTNAVGEHSNLFRPPFGGRRPQSLQVARDLGLQPIMWNVTGWDWDASSAEQIAVKVSRRIQGGDVILLHDGSHLSPEHDRTHTIVATDHLISRYKSEGYHFVTIPQMMQNSLACGVSSSSSVD
jgi:peptidoglycan-N-acetylglucosamine deacetylase